MNAPYVPFIDAPDSMASIKALRAAQGLRPKHGLYRSVIKRLLDLMVVLMVAPIILFLVGFLAFMVARNGGKPFYSQMRVGRDGRIFRMWKLRTMVVNADDMLDAYLATNPAAKAEWDHTQKLRNDPRIFSFGHFLRRSSLDELPQLWNVFIGDMSLVGPRPMMVNQLSLYPGLGYYSVRPGLTGFWQISERNQTSFAERAQYDDRYDREISFTTDLRVLLKTVDVVLTGTGV